jgi:hypothetical protein
MEPTKEHTRPSPTSDDDEDRGIDLRRLVRTLWSYRWVIAVATLCVMAIYAAFLTASYFVYPVRQEASLVFELPFLRLVGPDAPRYPNKAKFSEEDIIALPVLQEVYLANALSRYGKFETFRNGFTLTKSSARLEMLASEYRARLAEARLTAADRARIEQEYEGKRASLMSEPSFELTFRRQSRLREMPDLLLRKLLGDVLAVWARQSEERKGVLRSDVVIFSGRSLREDYGRETEPVVAVDVLRTSAHRMLRSLRSIDEIPGASSTRVGDARLSLGVTRARIQDLITLRLEPSLVRLIETGVASSPARVRSYLESRSLASRVELDEATLRVRALRASLAAQADVPAVPRAESTGGSSGASPADARQEPPGRPPAGSSFIDALMQLATRPQDLVFRQSLVDRLLDEQVLLAGLRAEQQYYDALLARSRATASGGAALPAGSRADLDAALAVLAEAAESVRAIHTQVVERNATPATRLYNISQPAVLTASNGLSQARVLQTVSLLLLGCVFVLPVLCLAHAALLAGTPEEQ